MSYEITDNIPYVPYKAKTREKAGRKNRHRGLEIEKLKPGQSVCLESLPVSTRRANSKVKKHENSIKCLIRDRNVKNLNYKVDFYVNRRTKEIRLWILDGVV